ncbi:MAG: amidase domain-containing protein [Clostridia bacterium]|nr:amidase domain-containing protein [Clostridia bacterium]
MKQYNRVSVVDYALTWWNSTNPNFYNYDRLGGDCTNFVSQCIFAGSGIMNYNKNNGWYYINSNNKSPSWTGVDFLKTFLLNNKSKGPFAMLCYLDEIELGDIIQIRQSTYFNHSLVVTKIENSNIYVTAHTNNVKNKLLNAYNPREIRCLKISGVYN